MDLRRRRADAQPRRAGAAVTGRVRVGVGGWVFEPWRGSFYPEGLPQKRELEYASRQLTSIEINGTYYGSQKPESFARWRDETPDDFVFAVKGPRFATNRRVLAEAGQVGRALLPTGRDGAQATSSARSTGSSWRPRSSTSTTSRPSSRCCRSRSRAARSATPSRCATRASATPEFVALAREHGVAVDRRARVGLSRRSPT